MPTDFISIKKKNIIDYIYSEKVQNIVFILFLTSLFVFAIMFGYGDNQDRYIYGYVALFLAYFAFQPGHSLRLFDFQALSILVAFFLMAVFKFIKAPILNPAWDYSYYAWLMPMIYLLGKASVGTNKRNFEQKGHTILFVMTVGMYIQGLLNYYMLTTPLADNIVASPGFWNREKWWGRNMWDVGFSMIIGALFYAFINRKKMKAFFLSTVVMIVVALGINLYFGGRTETLMTGLIFVILGFLYVVTGHIEELKKYKNIIIGILAFGASIWLIVYLLRVFDVGGFAKIYNESFLARDGGIFNNIRFRWAKEGLYNIITYGKGGWANSEANTTHNSWLEYGRNYDIVVFIFLSIFLAISIIEDIQLLLKYGNKYTVSYFAVGSKIGLLMLSMFNPDFYNCFDMMTFFILSCGITSGIKLAAESGDYGLINENIAYTKYRFSAVGFGILMMAMLSSAYMDWWYDRLNIVYILLIPAIAFLLGTVFKNSRPRTILMAAVAIASTILAIYMNAISKDANGYYLDPFLKGLTIKSAYLALWIIPIALILGIGLYLLKANKVVTALVALIAPGILFISQIRDGRIAIIKEAGRLLYCVTMKLTTDVEQEARIPLSLGTPWVNSTENYMGLTSSHNMWLDFARDYTVIVFGLLVAFVIWCIIAFVKVVLKKDKQLVDYVLIVAFVLFNYHFMFEATGFSNRYIFILGLVIYGMITSRASDDN